MIRRLASIALVVSVILGAVWPILSGDRFAFRDVSHFYLPLYDYVAERTSDEWLPLWNPLDHMGMPLIGETSTAVLYPIRYALYSLPMSSEASLNSYLLFHLLLASATSAWLAARIGCPPRGVLTAAIVYPLSGSVFSLCCNPPFLVGAAWIPLVLGACLVEPSVGGESQLRDGPLKAGIFSRAVGRRIAVAALAFSMMVLGGDPQSALHCVLVVVAVTVGAVAFRSWNAKALLESSVPRDLVRSMSICVSASCLAAGLSAIQIAASIDWSRQSDRALEIDRRTDLYDFSLAPWHAVELVSARPFGDPFPIHRRIAKLIPGEGRMWTPSIYAGFVVGFALLCRLADPRSYFADPWFVIAVVSLLLCFGHFGLVWLIQQIPGVMPDRESAIGGPYWILCQLVPGYTSFRYPVKWLPLFAIASSMVTARWMSTVPGTREQRIGAALAILLVGGMIGAHWCGHHGLISQRIGDGVLPIDEYWGPLDVAGGFAVARSSFLWSLLALLGLWRLRRVALIDQGGQRPKWVACGWILLLAFDCGFSASTLLPTVNIATERKLSHQASPSAIPTTRTLRTQAGNWPDRWRGSHSPERALEVAASERIAWFGRWHLAERQAVFNSMVSIRCRPYAAFWQSSSRELSQLDRGMQKSFWDLTRRWLGIEGISHVDRTRAVAAGGHSLVDVRRKWTGSVDDIRVVTEWLPEQPMSEIIARMRRSGQVPLPHVSADPPPEVGAGGGAETPAAWERTEEGKIVVRCSEESLLERCVFQDGNWVAKLQSLAGDRTTSVPVYRSSHLNQAVRIPIGVWTVTFDYRPWWKWPAILVMFASLAGLGFLTVWANRRGR